MKFTATLKFLGLENKSYKDINYTLINLLDLSTNKVFTLFVLEHLLKEVENFKPSDDITCNFELTKRIQDNKEIPSLTLLEVQTIGKTKA